MMNISRLNEVAKDIRKDIIQKSYENNLNHIGSNLSVVEIIVAIYAEYFLNPGKKTTTSEWKFLLSKGHAGLALYSVLSKTNSKMKNSFSKAFKNGSFLGIHPEKDIEHGIEISAGSLGHGISIACGMALFNKYNSQHYNPIYVLTGDGELNEGSNWEALAFASHHNLNNIILIIDVNQLQCLGPTKNILDLNPIIDKIRIFGWTCYEVNGHNIKSLRTALINSINNDKPSCIIANTIKGYGISFMMNKTEWHHKRMTFSEFSFAMSELE